MRQMKNYESLNKRNSHLLLGDNLKEKLFLKVCFSFLPKMIDFFCSMQMLTKYKIGFKMHGKS